MSATEHAPNNPFRLLERRYGLAEIVESGGGVLAEMPPSGPPVGPGTSSSTPTSSAHASTASATASLYFLSAWYCSALPPRCIFLHICLWPRRQWSCWQVLLQYLVWHLTHRGASWASGAAQAAQVVRIIFVWRRGVSEFRGDCGVPRALHAAS